MLERDVKADRYALFRRITADRWLHGKKRAEDGKGQRHVTAPGPVRMKSK